MTDVRVLTLWQPWASLIMLGVKTIETRSWPFPSTVPLPARILIHASKRPTSQPVRPRVDCPDCDGPPISPPGARHSCDTCGGWGFLSGPWLPLGAVLGWVTVTHDVPMIGDCGTDMNASAHLCNTAWGQHLLHHRPESDPFDDGRTEHDISDQLPYGDFTPDRFGWLLADPAPFDEPIPAKGAQGLWRPDVELLALVSGGEQTNET